MAILNPEQEGYEQHELKSADPERVRKELETISVIFKEYAKQKGKGAFGQLAALGAEIARRIVPAMQFKLPDVTPAQRINGGQKRYEEIERQRVAIRHEVSRLMTHWRAIFKDLPKEFREISNGFLSEIAAHFLFAVDLGLDVYYAKIADDLKNGTDLIVDIRGLIDDPKDQTQFLLLQVKSLPVTREAYPSDVQPLYIIDQSADQPMLDYRGQPVLDNRGQAIYTNVTLKQALDPAFEAANLTRDITTEGFDKLTEQRIKAEASLRRTINAAKGYDNVMVGVLWLPSPTLDHSMIDPLEGKLKSRPDGIDKDQVINRVANTISKQFDQQPMALAV